MSREPALHNTHSMAPLTEPHLGLSAVALVLELAENVPDLLHALSPPVLRYDKGGKDRIRVKMFKGWGIKSWGTKG